MDTGDSPIYRGQRFLRAIVANSGSLFAIMAGLPIEIWLYSVLIGKLPRLANNPRAAPLVQRSTDSYGPTTPVSVNRKVVLIVRKLNVDFAFRAARFAFNDDRADLILVAPRTSEPTALGVPTTVPQSKSFGWLGAGGLQTEFSSGIAGGSGGVYIPQLGLHLQPTGLGGAAAQNPVNEYLANQTKAQPTGAWQGPQVDAVAPPPLFTAVSQEYYEEQYGAKPPVNEPEGGGGDEWEVLTGKWALSLAHKFNAESLRYSGEAAICGQAHNTRCQTNDELVAHFYGEGAEKLEACYSGVHHGRHNRYNEFENGVCWLSWEGTLGGDPTNGSVEQCWSGSGAFGRYGRNEWYCPGHGWRQLRKTI
jgi:hypothetical protein